MRGARVVDPPASQPAQTARSAPCLDSQHGQPAQGAVPLRDRGVGQAAKATVTRSDWAGSPAKT